MTGILDCPLPAIGHVVVPANSVMNSRRRILDPRGCFYVEPNLGSPLRKPAHSSTRPRRWDMANDVSVASKIRYVVEPIRGTGPRRASGIRRNPATRMCRGEGPLTTRKRHSCRAASGWSDRQKAVVRARPPAMLTTGSRQFVEQCLCLFQVSGIEPLGEPAVNRRQQIVGFDAPALLAP